MIVTVEKTYLTRKSRVADEKRSAGDRGYLHKYATTYQQHYIVYEKVRTMVRLRIDSKRLTRRCLAIIKNKGISQTNFRLIIL